MESNDKSAQPRMNRDTHYRLTVGGKVLETRWDSSCVQFSPDPNKV